MQDPPKRTQIRIFDLKINHLAALGQCCCWNRPQLSTFFLKFSRIFSSEFQFQRRTAIKHFLVKRNFIQICEKSLCYYKTYICMPYTRNRFMNLHCGRKVFSHKCSSSMFGQISIRKQQK
jgi:hypothetical protein